MPLVRTPAPQHEAVGFDPLMGAGAVKRRGPDRPKRRPHRVVGDPGYRSGQIRHHVRQQGLRLPLPRKRHDGRTGLFARARSRLRHRLECLINRGQQFRRLATRDERRAANSKVLWLITATSFWVGVI
jgi:hypothetical protein